MGEDLIRLQVLMDYSAPIWRKPGQSAYGTAAVRWSTISPGVPSDMVDVYRAALIALLYAEVLVIHAETRAALTAQVDTALQRWKRSAAQPDANRERLAFDAWDFEVAGLGSMPLWPWKIIEPTLFDASMKLVPLAVGNPKIYSATLKAGPPSRTAPEGLWSFTEMPFGQEKVCVPSAPLIAATVFALEPTTGRPDSVTILCILLDHVNRYYRTLGRFPLASQAVAFAHGMAAFRQYAGQ